MEQTLGFTITTASLVRGTEPGRIPRPFSYLRPGTRNKNTSFASNRELEAPQPPRIPFTLRRGKTDGEEKGTVVLATNTGPPRAANGEKSQTQSSRYSASAGNNSRSKSKKRVRLVIAIKKHSCRHKRGDSHRRCLFEVNPPSLPRQMDPRLQNYLSWGPTSDAS